LVSRGAVNNLTISLSKDLGLKKIHVDAINPALVMTEGLEAAGFMKGEMCNKAVSQTSLGRVGRPNGIGKITVFLASDESYRINGQLTSAMQLVSDLLQLLKVFATDLACPSKYAVRAQHAVQHHCSIHGRAGWLRLESILRH